MDTFAVMLGEKGTERKNDMRLISRSFYRPPFFFEWVLLPTNSTSSSIPNSEKTMDFLLFAHQYNKIN